MRPIRLTVSAFGPYAGRQEIDMDALGERGLYLITGDTGAGKTTILTPSPLLSTASPAALPGTPPCSGPIMPIWIPPRR